MISPVGSFVELYQAQRPLGNLWMQLGNQMRCRIQYCSDMLSLLQVKIVHLIKERADYPGFPKYLGVRTTWYLNARKCGTVLFFLVKCRIFFEVWVLEK
jgi:hypothetical protein